MKGILYENKRNEKYEVSRLNGWFKCKSDYKLVMNLNVNFQKSVNLNVDFAKLLNLNLIV